MLVAPVNLTNEQLKDRAACFEIFRKSYRKNQALEENKEILKEKYARAKQLGAIVNNSRSEINRLKNQVKKHPKAKIYYFQIEELRKEMGLQGLINNENEVRKHPDENRLTNEIEKQKKL